MKTKTFIVGFVALCFIGCVTLYHYRKQIFPSFYSTVGGTVTIDDHTLPDPTLTPGVTNPDISQDNIDQNICNPHWSTKSIRPPSSYTTALKKKQIVQYGYSDTKLSDYEEDHLISLELGGSPTDPGNLWPESYPLAHSKDAVENLLHKEVCDGTITLSEAQSEISTDWYSVYTSQIQNSYGAVTSTSDPDDE